MQRIWLIAIAIVLAATSVRADHGKQSRFVGVHPIPKSEGGGLCYIEGPHVHIYAADKLQYRDHAGASYFVGDPVAYGYDGPHFAYKGPHPIHVEAVVGDDVPDEEYCYLEGPHFHSFQPVEGPDFKLVGNAYFYVGEPPHVFIEARPRYVGINAVYRPMVYARPEVVVEPPSGWIGARVDLPFVVVDRPVVVVPAAPVIDVRIPTPSIHVGVDIGVGIGGGVIYEGGRGHEHHDNGRHNGDRKHH